MRRFALIVFAALALVGARLAAADKPAADRPAGSSAALLSKAGFDIPKSEVASMDFTLDSLSGEKLSLGSFKGKLVFLNFWATWCGPCNMELPAIKALYQRLKPKGLVVVAVDLAEDKKTVDAFVKAKGIQFPVLLDTKGQVGGMYGTSSIPTTFIIDRTGMILGRKIGVDSLAWDSPESVALFEKLLAM